MAENEISDYFETDLSNVDISGITVQENVMKPSNVNNAFRALQGALKRWFKTSLFRLRDSTDQTKLLAFDLSGLTPGTRTVAFPDKSGTAAFTSDIPAPLKGHLYGLALSNNVTDATNDIDIAAGEASSDAAVPALMTLAAAITKRLDAAWAVGTGNGGLDTGAIANTTYHLYLIKRVDTGVVDVIFSASASAPTLPANYTLYRRIGSILRVGAAIVLFKQNGDQFIRDVIIQDLATTSVGTAASLRTLSVPTGLKVEAIIEIGFLETTNDVFFLITDPDQPDTAAGGTTYDFRNWAAATGPVAMEMRRRTNTSSQIRTRANQATVSTNFWINTRGWVDTRGRL